MLVSICFVLGLPLIAIAEAPDARGTCQTLDSTDDQMAAMPEGYLSLLQGSLKLTSKKLEHIEHTEVDSTDAYSLSHVILGMPMDIFIILVVFALALVAAFFLLLRPAFEVHHETKESLKESHRRGHHHALAYLVNSHPDEAENLQQRIHDCLEEDVYSLAIVLIARDWQALSRGEGNRNLKISRIGYSFALVFATIFLTVSLVICTKQFVAPLQVASIRETYELFEETMYDGHTYLNVNQKKRGIPGYFNASAFDNLNDEDKSEACNIPFSQVHWLMVILLVWSVTCVASIKKCFELFMAVVVFGDTKDDMADALVPFEEPKETPAEGSKPDGRRQSFLGAMISNLTPRSDDKKSDSSGFDSSSQGEDDESPPVLVITGLTMQVKMIYTACIFLPELATTAYLLWLGCRWLTATNDFGNLISNAVALEFILQLKCLLFYALASERSKSELKYTGIAPPWPMEGAGYGTYFNTLYWAALSVMWVYMYVFHLQTVLPDYHWDVKQVCDSYLRNMLAQSSASSSD
jgi:hypothetical protein